MQTVILQILLFGILMNEKNIYIIIYQNMRLNVGSTSELSKQPWKKIAQKIEKK